METTATLTKTSRLQSIDLLRGLVMVIMAIDHVRVYSGLPAGGPTAGIFFTRWITHYCAPSFVFLAGTSAFLYFQKSGDKGEVTRFLIIRGLILVLMELTIIRFFWMFNFDYATFTFGGVIWMLGWCMVLLAAFIRLRSNTLIIIGLVMIFAQQVFLYVPNLFPAAVSAPLEKIWAVFYPSNSAGKSGAALLSGIAGFPSIFGVSIFYVLIPWIGVMMAGYGFGQVFLRDAATIKKICLWVGLSAIALFIVAGTVMIFTAPPSDYNPPFLFKLLGQQKYPPSQLYLLMTLGPLIALLPWASTLKGKLAEALVIIGRVPMFYYILHLLLIHLSAFVVNLIISGTIHQEWYNTAPFVGIPEEQRWSLPVLYIVWAIDVVILYFACRWYAAYKANHPQQAWLKYL